MRESNWLANNLHLWVCRAWMKAGRPNQARTVLQLVPRSFIARGPLNVLKQRVMAGTLQSRWTGFLAALETQCHLPSSHAEAVRSWWSSLERIEPALPLPAAHPTAEGEFQFAWSYPSLLLEIDVSENGEVYWFGKDRDSGHSEDGTSSAREVSEGLRLWLEKAANA